MRCTHRSLAAATLPLLLVTLLAPPAPPARASMSRSSRIQAMKGVVLLLSLKRRGGKLMVVGRGSGSIIHKSGLILTNNHVVSDQKTNAPYDAVGVCLTTAFDRTPRPSCIAFPSRGLRSRALDLAVIKCEAEVNGQPLKRAIQWPAVTVGRSAAIVPGDDLYIVGYPAIGGSTITFTSGKTSGFIEDQQIGPRAWIKTDALIAPGVSGGAAFDDEGKLVGVPTQLRWRKGGRTNIGMVRPVDRAKQFLAQARRHRWGRPMTPNPTPPRPSPPVATPGPTPDAPRRPPDHSPPVGPTPGPPPVGPGEPPPRANPEQLSRPNLGPGLRRPKPRRTYVMGRLRDASTGQPIAGAAVLLLKPGIRVESLSRDTLGLYAVTLAVSTSLGQFRSRAPLTQGRRYGLVIMARGYRSLAVNGAVNIMRGTPSMLNLGTIRLRRQVY